jgi:hypothetical protein
MRERHSRAACRRACHDRICLAPRDADAAAAPIAARTDGGASRRTLPPPGVIGGAVICCARRSVRIARHQFARAIGMDHATIRDVELGEIPLFCVPYDLLRQIAGALGMPGSALSGGVGELVTAADFEDYAEVPPIDQGTPDGAVARELLGWALAASRTARPGPTPGRPPRSRCGKSATTAAGRSSPG